MPAANTDKLRKTRQRFSTTLSSGVTAADATLPCSSLSGVPTDTAVDVVLNRVDSNGTVQATWETVTAVVSGSNLTNALRGVEGTASAWGAGTVVEILWTAAQWNAAVDAILVEHDQDGTHGAVTVTTLDMQGGLLDLDADNDTSITADTDDQIDIEISGADDFKFTANTFTALSGSTIATNTIAETTPDAGVTVDGLLVKDGTPIFDGWMIADETWTYASASTITISGVDVTAKYSKGTRLKLTQSTGGTKYFVVASSSFSTNTTVAFISTSSYTLNNEAISSPFYSYAANPQGFPTWFEYVPTVTPAGSMTWADDGSTGLWSAVGSEITVYFQARGTTGGSASSGLGVSLPVAKLPALRLVASGFAFTSDASFVSAFGYTSSSASQSSIECRKYDSSNFALAGGTGARMVFTYQF